MFTPGESDELLGHCETGIQGFSQDSSFETAPLVFFLDLFIFEVSCLLLELFPIMFGGICIFGCFISVLNDLI